MSDVMKSVFKVNNKKRSTPDIHYPNTTTRTNQTKLAENDIEWDLSAHAPLKSSAQEKFQ